MKNISTEELKAEIARREQQEKEAKKPVASLQDIDLSRLVIACGEYIDSLYNSDHRHLDNIEHNIFEIALKTLYGPDVFDWIDENL